jgi:hypothetical protein
LNFNKKICPANSDVFRQFLSMKISAKIPKHYTEYITFCLSSAKADFEELKIPSATCERNSCLLLSQLFSLNRQTESLSFEAQRAERIFQLQNSVERRIKDFIKFITTDDGKVPDRFPFEYSKHSKTFFIPEVGE